MRSHFFSGDGDCALDDGAGLHQRPGERIYIPYVRSSSVVGASAPHAAEPLDEVFEIVRMYVIHVRSLSLFQTRVVGGGVHTDDNNILFLLLFF